MPDNLRKPALFFLFPLAVALVFFLGALFFYYRGSYSPPESARIPFQELNATTFSGNSGDFLDSPRMRVQNGTMLVDAAHRNAFNKAEIVTLLSRVAGRGYNVEFAGSFSSLSETERLPLLESGLGGADSFLVILPREGYTSQEVGLIKRFTDKGGKLLLMADPTRESEINSLAEPFGLDFQADYLFNLVEYDLNFQHIFVRNFQPDELTRELNEVAFYTAGSIKSTGPGLAFSDENTQSSLSERAELFSPLARGNHRNVLAVYDLTFVVPPHNSLLDNNRLISNIADFLTDSQREFELADFPGFFKGDVDILVGQPALFDLGADFKGLLADSQIVSELRETEDMARDTVFLGLYDNASQVAPYLQASGVQVGASLTVPSASDLPLEETSLIVLNRNQDRHVLIVLAQSEEALSTALDSLSTGDFRAGLVDDFVGVYKTQ